MTDLLSLISFFLFPSLTASEICANVISITVTESYSFDWRNTFSSHFAMMKHRILGCKVGEMYLRAGVASKHEIWAEKFFKTNFETKIHQGKDDVQQP